MDVVKKLNELRLERNLSVYRQAELVRCYQKLSQKVKKSVFEIVKTMAETQL